MPLFSIKEVRGGTAGAALGAQMFSQTESFQLTDPQRGRLIVATAMLGDLEVARVRSTGHRVSLTETDKFTFLAPVRGQIGVSTSGGDYCATGGSGLLFSPNRRTTWVQPPAGTASRNVTFAARVLLASERSTREAAGRAGLRWRRSGVELDLSRAGHSRSLQSMQRYLCYLSEELSQPSSLLDKTPIRATTAGLAMEQLLELLLEHGVLADSDSAATTSSRRVRTAEAYMRAHYATISSMVEVAEVAGVGLRSLQASFKTKRGLSPREVLTRTRLEEARRQLMTAVDSVCVTDVALACGFTHLGRFAQQYRRLYRESPSTTLGERTA